MLDSSTRLYRLEGGSVFDDLHVEAYVLEEALSQPWRLEIIALRGSGRADTEAMLEQPVTLITVLADGSEHRRTGSVMGVDREDSHGKGTRYRLYVQPWLGFLLETRHSWVWVDKSITAIVDSVLSPYAGELSWRWAGCVRRFLEGDTGGGRLSYCVQYRESDLAFISRLLAEAGIGYRFEEAKGHVPGPTIVFFAHSPRDQSCPENVASASPLGGAGLRFHRDGVQEAQDTIQAFGSVRGQFIAVASAVSYDYKTGRVIGAESPTTGDVGPLRLEAYDSTQGYAWATQPDAQRAMHVKQQALEARHERWVGRGVVRSLEAGTTFTLAGSMLDMRDAIKHHPDKRFLVTRVTHVGVNNLPKELSDTLTRSAKASERGAAVLPPWVDEGLRQRAAERGYANSFETLRASIPWRPLLDDGTGARHRVRPTVNGPLHATVVGPDGSTTPQGDQEIHTDALGRVLIRYEFQDADGRMAPASTWVRVQQPLAGDGSGTRWIPRIGHEVLVGFFDDDIERPHILCSLYNGRGEGGERSTPGGAPGAEVNTGVYANSTDTRPSGQGNLTGGNSPAWHGGSTLEHAHGGQRNTAALSGYKTKEFGGWGFNQLVFDDTWRQLRVQLATTQHETQLNLGHLIHQADNHRGSFRGLGAELCTHAYGAYRGGQGVLLSTYATTAGEPAGDNAAGIGMAKQWKALAEAFDRAAQTHQTVRFSGVLGTTGEDQSALDEKNSPIEAWVKQAKGMVSGRSFEDAQADAGNKSTAMSVGQVPHATDPVVQVNARAGLGMVSGQDTAFVSDENVQVTSGQDTDQAAGGALRVHTGQAIGILGGAIKPGDEAAGTGVTMVAGAGDIDVQAQASTLQVASLLDLLIQSQSANIDWAAAKRLVVAVAGGASLTIEGGNVTFACPGTITVHAGKKSLVGPERVSHQMPTLPQHVCESCLLSAASMASPFAAKT